MSGAAKTRWKSRVIAVLLFGISFGYVEAAVVTYLRPPFFAARPVQSLELFPLLTIQQIQAAGLGFVRMTETEIAREAATLAMLGTVAWAAGGSFRQWLAFFLLEFGAWDLAFYAFLKVLIDWPHSMLTWDVLFLIPVPWAGPVLAPVIVALTMIATGFVVLCQDANNHFRGLKAPHWIAICVGALLILAAFMWDCRNIMAGGMPNPFHWGIFGLGEALWLAAAATAVFTRRVPIRR